MCMSQATQVLLIQEPCSCLCSLFYSSLTIASSLTTLLTFTIICSLRLFSPIKSLMHLLFRIKYPNIIPLLLFIVFNNFRRHKPPQIWCETFRQPNNRVMSLQAHRCSNACGIPTKIYMKMTLTTLQCLLRTFAPIPIF